MSTSLVFPCESAIPSQYIINTTYYGTKYVGSNHLALPINESRLISPREFTIPKPLCGTKYIGSSHLALPVNE